MIKEENVGNGLGVSFKKLGNGEEKNGLGFVWLVFSSSDFFLVELKLFRAQSSIPNEKVQV